MKNKGLEKLIVLILIMLAFKSCKKDESSIDSIKIDKKAVLLNVNDSETLPVSVRPSGFNLKKLKWVSDNPDIATVANSGILKAIKPGTALITAGSEDGRLRDTCYVTVVRITNYTTTDGLLSNYIRTISADSIGNIWFGTINGVSKFDGTNWTSYSKSDGLAENAVNSIFFDDENNKWFCTVGGGVSEFNGSVWTTYNANDGLADNRVYCMTIDNNGNKWFGTENGLSKYDGTNWTTYKPNYILLGSSNMVFGLLTDKKNNNIWAMNYNGVIIYNGENWTSYSNESISGTNTLYGIFTDRYNNKWLASMTGIFKFDGAKWTEQISDKYKNIGFAHHILFDDRDNIWFTAVNGIYKYVRGNISTFENENFQMINKTEINCIAIDKNENVWIAKTFEGVFKLETK